MQMKLRLFLKCIFMQDQNPIYSCFFTLLVIPPRILKTKMHKFKKYAFFMHIYAYFMQEKKQENRFFDKKG